MGRLKLVALLAISLLVAACGANGQEAVPGGPDGVLLQYRYEGGFMPIEHVFQASPAFTVTTAGRLITQGFTDLRFPGPLVPVFFSVQLTPGEMSQLQSMIDRMGLAGITEEHDDTGSDMLADASTDVIVYWDSNGQHRYSAYAPGLGDSVPRGRTAQLVEIRTVLEQLGFSREPTMFEPTRARVIVGDDSFVDPEWAEEQDWPLEDRDISSWSEVAQGWRCRAFTADILERFSDAHQAMVWQSPTDATKFLSLHVRPLLPGEPDCPSL